MSDRQQRWASVTVDIITFRQLLCQFGVRPLKKRWVERVMRHAAKGLPPNAFIRNFLSAREPEKWMVFSFDEYMALAERNWREDLPHAYGAPMPSPVQERVAKVRDALPTAIIEVHALKSDDPFVSVDFGGEREWIGGWYGLGKNRRVFTG